MRKTSSVYWTDCSSYWILGCVILWFFTRHFTVDPINAHTYGLGRQLLSLWKVCFNQFISSFKLHLPRKTCQWCWESSSTGNMVMFLFIFALLVLQEISTSLLVPFCEVHFCGVFLQYFIIYRIWQWNSYSLIRLMLTRSQSLLRHFLQCTSHKCRGR